MKMSLKVKIMIMMFIIIITSLTSLGVFSHNKASNATRNLTEQALNREAESAVEVMNLSINSIKQKIDLLTSDANLMELAGGNDKSRKEYFEYFQEIQEKNKNVMENIFLIDSKGKGIVSNKTENYAIDFSDRDYYKTAMQGKTSVSDVILSKETNEPLIAIAMPLISKGNVVGAVVGTMKFTNITSDISKIKVGSSGYAYLIDKNGLVVYHPNKDKVLKENAGESKSPELNEMVKKMRKGESGLGTYTYEGVKKIAKYAPSDNWTIIITDDYNDYMKTSIDIRNNTIMLTIIFIVLAMIISYFMTQMQIIKPIKTLEILMTKAGNGDLTVKSNIKTKDEIQALGDYLNKMIESQREIIKKVRSGSEELAAFSEEISASTEEVSASQEEISSSIEEVAANAHIQNESIVETSKVLVELSSLVQIAQSKAMTAKINSDNTAVTAEDGRKKVDATVVAIENINKVSNETAVMLGALSGLSIKVKGIIETINNISAQTNLLALNAAIEAARAGEHGRGFTVVADEVRKLSEQTNVGSREINTLVNEMVSEIEKAVSSMDYAKTVVLEGVQIANETDKSFVSIIEAVNRIVKDVNQIVEITKDEAASSDQIVGLIDSVATIIEGTASSSQAVTASSEELSSVIQNLASSAQESSGMAMELNCLVEKFKV